MSGLNNNGGGTCEEHKWIKWPFSLFGYTDINDLPVKTMIPQDMISQKIYQLPLQHYINIKGQAYKQYFL